jgi:hypothetical protein
MDATVAQDQLRRHLEDNMNEHHQESSWLVSALGVFLQVTHWILISLSVSNLKNMYVLDCA